MTVIRDEMNWPMAETINRVSDQKLGGIDVSGSEENISVNVTTGCR